MKDHNVIPGLSNNVDSQRTEVITAGEARDGIYKGIEKSAHAVGCTMGPSGKTVLIQRDGDTQPIVTKDGVTVSKSINLKDRLQRMGANLVKEAASRTNDVVGDGTTTATVLTHSLIKEGLKYLGSNYNLREIKEGMTIAQSAIVKILQEGAQQIDIGDIQSLKNIAYISANNDAEVGDIVAEAVKASGVSGLVSVEDAKGTVTSMTHVKGVQIDRGYLSPYFINVIEKNCVDYPDAMLLVTDKKITSLQELVPVLEMIIQKGAPILIMCDDMEGEALQTIVVNRLRNSAKWAVIRAPGYGPERSAILDDICSISGATKISTSTGISLQSVTYEHLGCLKRIIVDAKSTTFVAKEERSPQVEERIRVLSDQLENTIDPEECEALKTRIAKLSGGVAVVRVGGATEVEMIERKYRIEDAINATKVGIKNGIVPGGGTALLYASLAVKNGILQQSSDYYTSDRITGVKLVCDAVLAPFKWIVSNTGKTPEVILDRVQRESQGNAYGYNAKDDKVENLLEAGIIDPVAVTITALQNAISVAQTFLSLDCAITSD